ncbi:hypothetical protein MRB53_041818 [Persea americana]|nr:hypothetical protein MRB53_041818 [Persea americana]
MCSRDTLSFALQDEKASRALLGLILSGYFVVFACVRLLGSPLNLHVESLHLCDHATHHYGCNIFPQYPSRITEVFNEPSITSFLEDPQTPGLVQHIIFLRHDRT